MGLFRKPKKSVESYRNSRLNEPSSTQRAAARVANDGEEDTLVVLEDVDTGIEFYMDIIDKFSLDGRTYVAMFPMVDKYQSKTPELVILRVTEGDGQAINTFFESVRDRRELNKAFDAFTVRYERSI